VVVSFIAEKRRSLLAILDFLSHVCYFIIGRACMLVSVIFIFVVVIFHALFLYFPNQVERDLVPLPEVDVWSKSI